ncbi:MAG: TonB-dependent receptor [Acidobacteria bacterium]|nr:TonB-dependent receptor [Acidobacteriota bacterium]
MRPIALSLLFATLSWAQTSTTAILGTVTDPAGAAVSGAKVRVVHDATQTVRETVTNESGAYFVSLINLGAYTVTVEQTGFQTARYASINVEVNARVRVDVALQIGGVTESVTVTGGAPAIQTDQASLGEVINQKRIIELPLNGRNVLQLATLSAGIKLGYRAPAASPGGGDAILGAGARENMNSLQMDGISIVNNLINTTTMRPSIDAVQEFRVQHGNYSAEYGMYLGVHVDFITKTGGNDPHGALFHFVRNNVFDARGFFENPRTPQNPLRRNEFGFVLTGPVYLPKVYNGRNKTFFMTNYEGLRFTRKGAALDSAFTEAMRRGDLSALGGVIRDPANPGQTFPGGIIPANRIAPQALEGLRWMPLANLPGVRANYRATTLLGTRRNMAISRIDHNFGSKAQLFVRYGWQNALRPTTQTNPFSGKEEEVPDRNLAVSYTHLVRPNILNEFRYGRQKVQIDSLNLFRLSNADAGARLGIRGITSDASNPGIPRLVIAGHIPVGDQGDGTQWFHRDGTHQLYNATTITIGNHSLKGGFEMRHLATSRAAANDARGRFNFTGAITGNAAADYLLGYPSQAITALPPQWINMRGWRFGGFFLDDWKATPKLTVNLGLRYDLSTVPFESTKNAFIVDATGSRLVPAHENGGIVDGDHNNFAPRIGLAYRPFGNKTVFRAGYGVYYNSNQLNNFTLLASNGFAVTQYDSPAANPNILIADPFRGTPGVAPPRSLVALDRNMPNAYMNQWSFNIQRELWTSFGVEAGYIGSRTLKLDRNFQMNNPRPGPGNVQARRPNQRWGPIRLISNDSFANYNALQVAGRQRLHKGASFLISYTWSKAIDTTAESNGGGTNMDPFNLALDRGRANWDFTHRFVGSYLYELPFFKATTQPFARWALAGWQVNGIATLETGQPFSVTIADDNANHGQLGQRANRIGAGTLDGAQRTLQRFFETAAFNRPAQFTFGNAGRNILNGPGIVNFDLSLFKNFRFGERTQLQFRFEAFNSLNTPIFALPGSVLATPIFGQVTATAQDNRSLQFGLRLNF